MAGVTYNIVSQCTNVATIIELVAHDFGVGLLSKRVAMSFRSPGVSIVRIVPTISGTISLAFRTADYNAPKTMAFINYSTQWLEAFRYEKINDE